MPKYTYSRISITLPPEVLATADRLAREQGRPRSWIFAEAIRRLGADDGVPAQTSADPPTARPSAGDSHAGRDRHLERLEADLELSVDERVRASEQLAAESGDRPTRPADQILFFNRFEEYLRWDERSRSAS